MITLRGIHWLGLGVAATAATSGVVLLYKFDPNAAGNPFPGCIFLALTGFYCPGCGMTRAMHALVHFHPVEAFSMNPAVMTGLCIVPGLIAWAGGWRARWFAPIVKTVAEPKFWLYFIPAYWIARNLPWFPFTLLAPG